jgi:hypothetical protein
MVELWENRPQPLTPEDRFYIEFYPKMRSRQTRQELARLRKMLAEGSISEENAREALPRHRPAKTRLKQIGGCC